MTGVVLGSSCIRWRGWLTALAVTLGAGAVLAPAADPAPRAAAPIPIRFSPSTTAGGATAVTWGFRFQATATVDPTQNQVVSVTGPAGSFRPNAATMSIVDLTTGVDDSTGADVTPDGTTAEARPRNAIAAGDLLAVDVTDVNNPASGTSFSGITVSPSADNALSGSFTNPQPVSILASTTSTTAAGATGVTWGLRFRLSSIGNLPSAYDRITVTAPQGATIGTGGASLVDLTTFTNEEVGVQTSDGGRAATISPVSAAAGDLLELDFYDDTNPAAGSGAFTVTTNADTVGAQTPATTFTSPQLVGTPRFTTSSTAGGATANWGLSFTTSSTGRLLGGGSIVIDAPAGTTFPTSNFAYTIRDENTGGAYAVHSVASTATGSGEQLTMTAAQSGFATIRASDVVSLIIQGVTNASGGVTAGHVSVSTSSDPEPVTAAAPSSSASGSVAGVHFYETGRAAGATGNVWTAQFETSKAGALAANSGTITVTAPAGTFQRNATVVLLDLTSATTCCNAASTSSDGSSVTVTPAFAIGAGDMLELEVHQVVNPATGSYPAGDFGVATSSDTTVANPSSGLTFTAAKSPTSVTIEPTTFAGGATETTWATLFTASPTGGISDDGLDDVQIQATLPPSSATETERCASVYDMTTGASAGCGGSFTPTSVTMQLVPSAVTPGDMLALIVGGVTNPAAATYPANDVTVTTSTDTRPGNPASPLTFTPANLPTTDLLQNTDQSGSASDDRIISEYQASPTGEIASARSQWGSITLGAPSGTQFASGSGGCTFALDLTTGNYFCDTPASTSGSSDTLMPVQIGAGDVVELSVGNITNPPSGLVAPTGFHVATSSDDGAPSVTGDPFMGTEGTQATGPVMTVNGDCPASGTITSWGDGAPSSPASISCQGLIATVSGTHTYDEFGSYPISASTDDGSHGTTTATIADAPLTATAVTGLTATAGASFSGTVAKLTDANPDGRLNDFSATIDWGDGTPPSAGTITGSGGNYAVHGTHTYTTPQNATVVIHVGDAGGSTAPAVGSLTVNAAGAPAVTLTKPGNGSTVTTATPTFSGRADTGAADVPQITVKLYAGSAVSSSPVQTLHTTAAGSAWSVSASAALSNGTYTAQAQQSTTTGVTGFSAASVFTVIAPATTTKATGPQSGGGPPPGCAATANFGVIAALGCLQAAVDEAQIPSADEKVLCTDLKLDTTPCQKKLESEIKKTPGSILIAQAIVRVNGLDITPDSGATVVFDANSKRVVSSHATVRIMDDLVSLYSGPLTLDGSGPGEVKELEANLDQLASNNQAAATALDLGAGFSLTGTLSVKLQQSTTTLTANVKMPGAFSAIGISGAGLSAQAVATADDSDDVQFNELYFKAPSFDLFGSLFEMDDLAFCYQNHISDGYCQSKTQTSFGNNNPDYSSWDAIGKLGILGVSLDAAPPSGSTPPPYWGLGFVNGAFDYGGAQLNLGSAASIPLFPPVSLTSLGVSLGLHPTAITGEVGLNVKNFANIEGHVFLVFPTQGQPYQFTGGELGSNTLFPPLSLPRISAQNFALAVGGKVYLTIPLLGTEELADGYVMYAAPTYIAAGGGFNINLFNGAVTADGGLQGQFNFGSGQFEIAGSLGLGVNVLGFQANLGVEGVVSSVGIGGCGYFDNYAAGVGYKWGQGLSGVNLMIGSCDLTPYEEAVSASAVHDAAAGDSFQVRGGLPNEMVRVIGHAGAPDVTITGPGGIHATTAGGAGFNQPPFVIGRNPQLNTTTIAIIHPAAGRYTITTNPGSPAIGQILDAHGFTPTVKARVSGRGGHRALRYSFNAQPGELFTFLERGTDINRVIGSSSTGHGTVKFKPAPGPGGTRQILAMVTEDGAPVVVGRSGQLVVASYRAPGPLRLGRIRGLHARRTGNRLNVSFARVPHARKYVVLVLLRSGLHTDEVIRTHTLRMTVPGAGPPGGTVEVRALGDGLTTVDGAIAKTAVQLPKPPHKHRKHRRHHPR